jgi:simple sugar transport system permease protein
VAIRGPCARRPSRAQGSALHPDCGHFAYAGITSLIQFRANPNSGTQYELEVIAMVVIGGTALSGGRGTIIGTVIGVLILRMMQNGIIMIGVPGLAYNIFIGAIILIMMALHSWLERRHRAGT